MRDLVDTELKNIDTETHSEQKMIEVENNLVVVIIIERDLEAEKERKEHQWLTVGRTPETQDTETEKMTLEARTDKNLLET